MEFDYVIVGGGSAGSVLAARLSEDPALTVCLIESGGEGRDLLVRMPAALPGLVRGKPKINNWAFQTEPQAELKGRRGYQPRGRALGGSSAINAMLYVRGHPSDYDDWAAQGCSGWGWNDVLPWFRRAEGNQRGADDLHGADGPLKVANQRSPRPLSEAFVAAAVSTGIPRNDDFNGSTQEGVGLYQVTQFWGGPHVGERCSAAAAYLHPVMGRRNLMVMTRADVAEIKFDGRRASGVSVRRGGDSSTINARREVIVSAGAFGSPKLLMLSGIGPADELAAHGIAIRHHAPGVGRNLQDHLDHVIGVSSTETDSMALNLVSGLRVLREARAWRRDGSGLLATPYAEVGAFLKSSPNMERPDLQLHFLIGALEDHGRILRWGHGFACHVCVLRPKSRGTVGLKGADPLLPPRIDPQFLSAPEDRDLMVKGVRRMQVIFDAQPIAGMIRRPFHPFVTGSDEEILEHVRARADTIYHPVGTCRMGSDAESVVDVEMKVRGVDGLRVIDASVMPTLIGGNTNAPTIMMAEKMAASMRRH